jgi:D-amino acid aminotransferase
MAKVYLNTGLIDEEQATIRATDVGFLYGAGLFETMRCQSGTVFCLNDHLDRLWFSMARLGIDLEKDNASLRQAVYQVLEANQLTDARLRLTVSAGSFSAADQKTSPTLLITAAPLQTYPDAYYEKGVLVVLSSHRQNPADPLAGHKTTNYFARMLALQEAHQKKAAEALWFTTEGYLAEGCISNVFLVKDGALQTPPLETPVLAGVARKTVCALALEQKITLEDKPLTIDDLLGADEVFLTNVIMTVLPVAGIEQHTVNNAQVGPVTRQLQDAFRAEIERQCGSLV